MLPLQKGKPHSTSQLFSLQSLVKINVSAFAVTIIIRYSHRRQPVATSGVRSSICNSVHNFAAWLYS